MFFSLIFNMLPYDVEASYIQGSIFCSSIYLISIMKLASSFMYLMQHWIFHYFFNHAVFHSLNMHIGFYQMPFQ